jgi:hypothetical protein
LAAGRQGGAVKGDLGGEGFRAALVSSIRQRLICLTLALRSEDAWEVLRTTAMEQSLSRFTTFRELNRFSITLFQIEGERLDQVGALFRTSHGKNPSTKANASLPLPLVIQNLNIKTRRIKY